MSLLQDCETPRMRIEQADAFEWLPSLDSESVDLTITDPPYESLEKHRKIGTTTRLKREWFETIPNERYPELLAQLYRVHKRDTHLYLFSDHETLPVAVEAGRAAGWTFWKPLVWDKIAMGMGYHYRARYEFVLFFEKGKRKLYDLGIPDVLQFKRVYGGYPTEKPVELCEVFVMQSSDPGAVVCDPFMGSGSTAVAAGRLKRSFIGCDLSDKAITQSEMRTGVFGEGT